MCVHSSDELLSIFDVSRHIDLIGCYPCSRISQTFSDATSDAIIFTPLYLLLPFLVIITDTRNVNDEFETRAAQSFWDLRAYATGSHIEKERLAPWQGAGARL
jgi:hypothetical protein